MRFPRISLDTREWTLKNRLVLGVSLLAALGFLVSGILAQSAYRTFLMQEVDSQLTTIVESSLLRLDRAGIEAEEGADAGRPFRPLEPLRGVPTAAVITLIDFQGQILGSVGGDLSASKIEIALDRVLDRDSYGVPFTFESGNSHYRVLALELPSRVGIVIASISLEDVDDSIARLQYLMLLIGVATMILIIVLSRRAITISLKPLAAVESTAEAIAEGNLSARLPIAKPETEVGRLVGSLNQMLTRIEDSFAVRVKSEEKLRRFVADASHELRTPLTAIRGFAELHRQGAVTGEEKTRELIGRIEDESIRMGTLVEDLLLLARLDQSPEIEREPVNLNELIHSASESARASSPEHQISMILPDEELFILGDRNRIFQVVANLLENARNHTPAGSSIQVSLTESEDEIKIEVADNGPGIDKHDLERIFERFYRADSSRTRTRKSEGSGLGLSIVKAVMQAHGGDVTVDSTMGVGSTFTLHFPIGKED
ncbi:MAG: sensor histidine kinase [Actinobacteria bacterium]|nr:sensor histidine kinase [Actinomycetota bacterium]